MPLKQVLVSSIHIYLRQMGILMKKNFLIFLNYVQIQFLNTYIKIQIQRIFQMIFNLITQLMKIKTP